MELLEKRLPQEAATLISPISHGTGDGREGGEGGKREGGSKGPTSIQVTGQSLLLGSRSGSGQAAESTESVEVKLRVRHILSRELQEYFDRVTRALEDREDGAARSIALTSLSKDPGLHQLLPYFIQYITDHVAGHTKDLPLIHTTLQMVQALMDNPYFVLEHYLEQLVPAILSCTVTKRLGSSPLEDHWAVREQAARLAASLVPRFGQAYPTLRPRLVKTYLRGWLDPTRPLTTQYGALCGLGALGAVTVRSRVLGQVRAYAQTLTSGPLLDSNATKRMEADRVKSALIDVILVGISSDGGEEKRSMGEGEKEAGEGEDEEMDDPAGQLDEVYGPEISQSLQDRFPSTEVWRALVQAARPMT